MSDTQNDFLKDQKTERLLVCTAYVDQKWAKTSARKLADERSAEKRKAKDSADQEMLDRSFPSIDIDDHSDDVVVSDDDIDDASIAGYETGKSSTNLCLSF